MYPTWMMPYNLSRSHRVKPGTASHGPTMQKDLSSCTVGRLSVCVCEITHVLPPHCSTPAVPLFDHSFFSVHRANWVCACATDSRLQLFALLYNQTDRWVFLWVTHTLKQAWVHRQKHITRFYWVTKLISVTPLYVCIVIYWPLSANTASKDPLKMTGKLLTQVLVVRLCAPSDTSRQEGVFRHSDAHWKEVRCEWSGHFSPQTKHTQLQRKMKI